MPLGKTDRAKGGMQKMNRDTLKGFFTERWSIREVEVPIADKNLGWFVPLWVITDMTPIKPISGVGCFCAVNMHRFAISKHAQCFCSWRAGRPRLMIFFFCEALDDVDLDFYSFVERAGRARTSCQRMAWAIRITANSLPKYLINWWTLELAVSQFYERMNSTTEVWIVDISCLFS